MNIIPIEHQEDYAKILEYINAYKNGITSDTMRSYGIEYKQNYGVAIPDLKRIAGRFSPNHTLANSLWQKEWRETYILSTLLDKPEQHTLESLSKRVNESPSYETLEQLAYNMAWQLDFLDQYFNLLKDKTDLTKQYFFLKSTTYQLSNKKINAQQAWERIKAFPISENASLLSILQNLLLRISSQTPQLHQELVAHCKANKSKLWLDLAEVVREYGVIS